MAKPNRSLKSPLAPGRIRRQLRLLFPAPVSARRFIRAIMRIAALRRIRGAPIFIVGCGRSGTTMLLSILSADPRLFCIHQEAEAFINLSPAPSSLRLLLCKCRIWWLMLWQPEPLEQRVCWVEKTPRHIWSIPAIRKAFRGRVRFIHLVRDGRDVITSRLPGRSEFHIDGDRWVEEVKVGLLYEQDPDFVVVRYEDLVTRLRETMQQLYRFLELAPPEHEQVESFAAHATLKRHWAWPAEVQDVHSRSIGRWRDAAFAGLIAAFLALSGARELLKHHGYSSD